ncbi:MAG: hypothetical protein ACRENP_22190 [Longimicrobiales bacterium]
MVPLLIAYAAFVVVSWLVDPLLSLLLMARADARQYLNQDDKQNGMLVGACLAAAILFAIAGVTTGWETAYLAAFAIGFTSFTVAAAHQSDPGTRRRKLLMKMAAAAAVLSLATSIVPAGPAVTMLTITILLVVASTWMSRFMSEH